MDENVKNEIIEKSKDWSSISKVEESWTSIKEMVPGLDEAFTALALMYTQNDKTADWRENADFAQDVSKTKNRLEDETRRTLYNATHIMNVLEERGVLGYPNAAKYERELAIMCLDEKLMLAQTCAKYISSDIVREYENALTEKLSLLDRYDLSDKDSNDITTLMLHYSLTHEAPENGQHSDLVTLYDSITEPSPEAHAKMVREIEQMTREGKERDEEKYERSRKTSQY